MRSYDSAAAQAYEDGQEAVSTQVAALLRLLIAHRRTQRTDPHNWGWAGDMEYVSARLGEIVQFLEGDE